MKHFFRQPTMVKNKHGKESSVVSKKEFTSENNREGGKPLALAHNVEANDVLRTKDILTTDDVEFKNLLLPEFILDGLTAANFHRPSPIQLRSIPLLRLGLDLIVQSKAGTGKTLVITLAVLETVNLQSKRLQVIVVAPTREIALQTKHFISVVSANVSVRTEVFIGGTSVKEDRKNLLGCQVAIGTPGRLNSLIESGDMSLCHVRLFVLDEADKLMEKSIFPQVKSISKLLPGNKQTILCSATFLQPVKEYVVKHMKEPFWVTPEGANRLQPGNFELQSSSNTVLLGVTQFFKEVPNHAQIVKKLKFKLEEILEILAGHAFTQCIIFSNYQTRAETICHQLVSNGWPAISVRGQDEQAHRTATLTSFKEFQSRVLLTTDVMSRGVDFRGVDLVINLDIPYDSATYLHRMGRAGRFGSYGCAITLASMGDEVEAFRKILSEINDTTVYTLPTDLSLIKKNCNFSDIFFGPSTTLLHNSTCKEEEINEPCIPKDVAKEDHETVKVIDVRKLEVNNKTENNDENCTELAKIDDAPKLIEENLRRKIPEPLTETTANVDQVQRTIEPESRMDGAIQCASAELNEVLCVPRHHDRVMFRSFEDWEETYSDWIEGKECFHLDDTSFTEDQKCPAWWSSANILLTAVKLQLEELKAEADSRPELDLCVEDLSSDSSDKQSNKKDQEKVAKINYRKKSRKQKNCAHHNSSAKKVTETSDVHGHTWLWDESSKVYYYWDSASSHYHLYNPELESYFKWEPGQDRYFKWDSSLQKYRLWDCGSGCYLDAKEPRSQKSKSFPRNSTKSCEMTSNVQNNNYVQWFSLWNKHLQQMNWQIYQAEYLQNLCETFKNL